MRIQILSQYYEPEVGAPQVRLKAMADEFTRRGHEVEVVTALPSYPVARIFPEYRRRFLHTERRGGVTVRRVWIHAATGSGAGRLLNFASFAALATIPMARTRRPDVVLVESPPLFVALPALVDSVVRRRPFALLVADLWPDTAIEMGLVSNRHLQRLLYALERWAYRRSAFVAPVTEGQVETLRDAKGVPADRICLVRNGVDVELFRPGEPSEATRQLLSPGGERVIMFAGTLGYAQALDVIVDAAPIVCAAHPDARIVFVGSGSERARIEARVADEGVAGITFLDPRPLTEIAELYKGVTAGLTTLRDSPVFAGARPSKIFPMMAAGLPVIYSGRGEGARLVGDAGAGVCAEPEDARALAAAMIEVLDDPERSRRMGAAGRRLVEAEFSWSRIVGDFLEFLEGRDG
jgi:glycosyltransferase involved in cell wall biosynthesis